MADCLLRELSFKHSLQLWLAWRQFDDDPDGGTTLRGLLVLAAQQRVGNRPGELNPEPSSEGQSPTHY